MKLSNYPIILFVLITSFLSCQKETEIEQSQYEFKNVEISQNWFYNNPEKNNFALLNFTEEILWNKSKEITNNDFTVIEVPIRLRENISFRNSESKFSTNRIGFIMKGKTVVSSFIINISSDSENQQLIQDLNKINYFNIPKDFNGDILIIKNSTLNAKQIHILDGEVLNRNELQKREFEETCYAIVEIFSDGSIEYTGYVYCTGGGGGSGWTDDPTEYHYHSGGYAMTPTIDEQIDLADLDPCSKAILQEIIDGKSIEEIVNQFAEENSQFDWEVYTSSVDEFDNPENQAETNFDPYRTGNSYFTRIKNTYSSNATRLSIARTLVHESIHAYILSYLDSELSEMQAEFPELLNEFVTKKYGDPNDPSNWSLYNHQEIARNYVNTIASAIADFDNNQHTSDLYTDLAWGGLLETKIFQETNDLTDEDRRRIEDINKSEDTNQEGAVGNPCN